MSQFRNILLATSFSERSKPAVESALALAKESNATLHIAHALEEAILFSAGLDTPGSAVTQGMGMLAHHARECLDKAVTLAKGQGIDARGHLLTGNAPADLVGLAEDRGCRLIVIGSTVRSALNKLFFGSVGEKIVRHSHVPVLTVGASGKAAAEAGATPAHSLTHLKRVLLPCDLSGISDGVAALAAGLCRRSGATLVLMHVLDELSGLDSMTDDEVGRVIPLRREGATRALRQMAEQYAGIPTEIHAVAGTANTEVVRTVEDKDIDLVVMATHGRRGIGRTLFGSTSEKVIRGASCPVLTVCTSKKVSRQVGAARTHPPKEAGVWGV